MISYGESTIFSCFLSNSKHSKVEEALADSKWITAMQEELNECIRSNIRYLVDRSKHQRVIGTQRVFKIKTDENHNVVRNKARLVVKNIVKKKELI